MNSDEKAIFLKANRPFIRCVSGLAADRAQPQERRMAAANDVVAVGGGRGGVGPRRWVDLAGEGGGDGRPVARLPGE